MIRRIIGFVRRRCNWLKWVLRLKEVGVKTVIVSPLKIDGAKRIYVGSHTIIEYKSWLAAMPLTGHQDVELRIGSHCAIGHFNEIYATHSIVIEDYVLTADRVYISDNLHGYENPDAPVISQPIRQVSPVRIGEGSWLGVGVAVIGASIGRHCVIGANAVVTKDIPDFCVAVGAPARIVKRYNPVSGRWEKTAPDGAFIERGEA